MDDPTVRWQTHRPSAPVRLLLLPPVVAPALLKTLPTKQQPTLSELPPLQGLDLVVLLLVSETFSEAQAALQEPG